jgi:hypothetical protein
MLFASGDWQVVPRAESIVFSLIFSSAKYRGSKYDGN